MTVKWDSVANIEIIKKNVVFLMKGCKCRGGCKDIRCGCFKQHKDCGPGCKCSNCRNLHNGSGACKGTRNQNCPRLSESNVKNAFEDAIREVNKNEQVLEDKRRKEEQNSEMAQMDSEETEDDDPVLASDQDDSFDESDLEDML